MLILIGSLMVMLTLFGIGKIIFAEYLAGLSFVAISIALGFIISYNLSKLDLKE